ncbi:uncharacterized protein LOC110813482 [Carica papaya]|uniref:uncharacterized protein LOC110813482 n=1 Tax=Carica papaya TaxID=3649 RepID=UPI000B8CE02B|nr:uncharacterized protein LOC110813482 [Carica papaya]
MDEIKGTLRKNRLEDVSWLCSLSEAELDFLISLKILVLQRAKIIGHDELAKKFDLRMLRALGFILMEHVRGKIKNLSVSPCFADSDSFMNDCNLLKSKIEDVLSIEEIKDLISTYSRKRPPKRQ